MRRLLASAVKGNRLWWVVWPAWAVLSFFGSLIVAGLVVFVMKHMGLGSPFTTTVGMLAFEAVIYVIMLAIMLSVPYAKKVISRNELGVGRSINWADIGLGLAGYVVYFLIFVAVTVLVKNLLPSYDAEQAQDLGFTTLRGFERYAGFIVFVVVAPLAEELIMRGFLLGKLRAAKLPFWPAAVVVSALFGLAHGQWNVGIDTFILSMVACYLREATGTIWPGFIIHMTKNLVAYMVLFVLMVPR